MMKEISKEEAEAVFREQEFFIEDSIALDLTTAVLSVVPLRISCVEPWDLKEDHISQVRVSVVSDVINLAKGTRLDIRGVRAFNAMGIFVTPEIISYKDVFTINVYNTMKHDFQLGLGSVIAEAILVP